MVYLWTTVARTMVLTSLVGPILIEARSLRAHSGTSDRCGSLVKCTLRNIDSGIDILLKEGGDTASTEYDPSTGRFTVHCETNGNLNKMTYTYLDQTNQKELHQDTTWSPPWRTDEFPTHIQSATTLTLQIVGETWTEECFADEFTLVTTTTSSVVNSQQTVTTGSSSLCSFTCPIYSQPKEGLTCVSGLDSCRCQYSYKLVSGHCVKDWCYHDYTCPQYKERIPGIDCYSSIRDCRHIRLPQTLPLRTSVYK